MNEKETFLKSGLIEEYVLGLSNASDKRKVEFMAAKHQEVAELLKQTRQSMEHYCRSSREEAAIEIKERLYHAMRVEKHGLGVIKQLPNKHSKPRRSWMPIAITFSMLALSVCGMLWYKNSDLKKQLLASKSANDDMIARMNSIMATHKTVQQQFTFLQDLDTDQIRLELPSKMDEPMAVIYWNRTKKEALMHIINLPKTPLGMTYQLWGAVKGNMKDMGIIAKNSDWISVPFLRHIESLHITLEKRGGSLKPTLEKLVSTANI